MLSNTTSLAGLVGVVIGFINLIIPVLIALALVLFMYSGVRYAVKSGDSHGKGAERDALMWGIIALFVLVSVWGILRIMCSTLFGNSSCSATSTQTTGGLY